MFHDYVSCIEITFQDVILNNNVVYNFEELKIMHDKSYIMTLSYLAVGDLDILL